MIRIELLFGFRMQVKQNVVDALINTLTVFLFKTCAVERMDNGGINAAELDRNAFFDHYIGMFHQAFDAGNINCFDTAQGENDFFCSFGDLFDLFFKRSYRCEENRAADINDASVFMRFFDVIVPFEALIGDRRDLNAHLCGFHDEEQSGNGNTDDDGDRQIKEDGGNQRDGKLKNGAAEFIFMQSGIFSVSTAVTPSSARVDISSFGFVFVVFTLA